MSSSGPIAQHKHDIPPPACRDQGTMTTGASSPCPGPRPPSPEEQAHTLTSSRSFCSNANCQGLLKPSGTPGTPSRHLRATEQTLEPATESGPPAVPTGLFEIKGVTQRALRPVLHKHHTALLTTVVVPCTGGPRAAAEGPDAFLPPPRTPPRTLSAPRCQAGCARCLALLLLLLHSPRARETGRM